MSRKSTPDILDKRIPRNPKYENVQPTIDTGASMPKYLAKMESSGKMKDRSGELFKIVKPRALANLILREHELLPQVATSTLTPTPTSTSITHPQTTQSIVGSTLHPDDAPPPPPPAITPGQSSFILLDIRDPEEYEAVRIKGAISYPAAILSRAINYFTADLYYYKNKENKMVLIYDEEEKVAGLSGNTFYQKGVDNIFVLEGGLRAFYEEFPDLVVGALPPKPGTPGSTRKSNRDSDRASTAGSVTSTSSKTSVRSTMSKASISSKKTTTASSSGGTKAWK